MGATRTAIALALLAAGMLAAPASAAPSRPTGSTPADYLGTIPEGFSTDGRHLGVWTVRDGVIRVRDSRTGSERDVANACDPGDGSFGRFLLHCLRDDGSIDRYIWRPFEEPRSIPAETRNDVISGVGRYWASGTTQHLEFDPNDDRYGATLFIDLRTGERREFPRPGGYDAVRDIDSPDLRAFSPPRKPESIWSYSGRDAVAAVPPRNRLTLYRDGTREAVLSKRDCLAVCVPSFHLEGGRITWIEQAGFGPSCVPDRPDRVPYTQCFRVRGYVVSTGVRANWLVKGVEHPECVPGCHIHVAHTRDEVFVSVVKRTQFQGSNEVPVTSRLFTVPWPQAPRR